MKIESPYVGAIEPFSLRVPAEIIFGSGCSGALTEKVVKLGSKRPLFITGAKMAANPRLLTLMDSLADSGLEPSHWKEVEPEPPVELLEGAARFALEKRSDCVIAFGGGSSMDFAKILSVMVKYPNVSASGMVGVDKVPGRGIPSVMIPTTSGSGSEVTPVSILSFRNSETKKGVRSAFLIPDIALVDPALTLPLPAAVTAVSGIDALVHAVESYLSANANVLSKELALSAVRWIAKNLETCVKDGSNLEAREGQSYGSLLAGMAFAMSGTAAVHALSYPLGARYKISHGEANALILKEVMEYNALACPGKMAAIAEAMGEKKPGMDEKDAARATIGAMSALAENIGLRTRIRELGLPAEPAGDMARDALQETTLLNNNPCKLTVDDIKEIYEKAW